MRYIRISLLGGTFGWAASGACQLYAGLPVNSTLALGLIVVALWCAYLWALDIKEGEQ